MQCVLLPVKVVSQKRLVFDGRNYKFEKFDKAENFANIVFHRFSFDREIFSGSFGCIIQDNYFDTDAG